jgi:hypothetical protein
VRIVVIASLVLVALFVAPFAHADPLDAGASDDASVAADFDEALEASASSDCAIACKALESLRRAAERICALDPGERCADARDRLARAEERVRSACPACAVSTYDDGGLSAGEGRAVPEPAKQQDVYEETTLQSSPQKRGGCAACTSSSRNARSDGAIAFAAFLVALLFTRRRRARRERVSTPPNDRA